MYWRFIVEALASFTHIYTHIQESATVVVLVGGSKRGCRDKELRQWGVGVGGCCWYWLWWERVGA